MSLSTTQYGYIVDPMVPFTDDKGKTIKKGFIRVFMAGTSTPVLTYRNYDGATNQEKIELDNSGRVKHNVIGSKGSLYKVVVYDAHHSQETPILTVDKIAVLGASINATGATIVTGLDSVTVQEENFLKATVEGTGVELALDPTEVTSEVSTIADAATAATDYVVPLLDKTGEGDSKKISLANLFKFALDWISRLATTITSFVSGDYIVVSNPTDGARKMATSKLMELTAQNALGSIRNLPTKYKGFMALDDADGTGKMDVSIIFNNFADEFDPTRTSETKYLVGQSVVYLGKRYKFLKDHYGSWTGTDVTEVSVSSDIKNIEKCVVVSASVSLTWERGNIGSTGNNAGSTTAIRTNNEIQIDGEELIVTFNPTGLAAGSTFTLYEYGEDDSFIKYSSKGVAATYLFDWTPGHKFRVKVNPSDSTAIDVEDGDDIIAVVYRAFRNLETDKTLSNADRPADAKSVGDALAEISNNVEIDLSKISDEIEDINDCLVVSEDAPLTWERGNIGSTGNNAGSTTAIRTKDQVQFNGTELTVIYDMTGLALESTFTLYDYDSSGTFVSYTSKTGSGTYKFTWTPGHKFRVKVNPSDSTPIAVEDGDDIIAVRLKYYRNLETDKTLSLKNRPADAKSVGDALSEISPCYSYAYKIVKVDANGNGDFTTLRGAVDSITDASADNPYMIEVYPGVYDVLDDYSEAEIREANPSQWSSGFVGIQLTDGMNIRGVGERDTIILNGVLNTGTYDTDIRNCISTINLSGSGIVENLTIKASNLRYCVHDSLPFYGPDRYTRVMRNVKMIAHNLTSSNAGNPTCYGGTIRQPGGDYLFENCDIGGRFLKHGSDNAMSDTKFVVKNCRARTFLYEGANDGHHHQVLLDGCDFESVSIYDDALAQSVFVTATGLNDCCVVNPAGRLVITGAILKAVANSLTAGTLVKHDGRGFAATIDKSIACGVVVGGDSDFCYIQVSGHLNSSVVGLSGLSVGDYVTADVSGKLTTTGATSANAVGVVDYIDPEETGVQFIRILF